jgi:hypothetical protein
MDTLEKVLEKYISAALQQEKATVSGEHKLANKAHKIRTSCVDLLKNNWSYLEVLLDHENKNVRLWSAYDLLANGQYDNQCIEVLRVIATHNDIFGLSAQMALKRFGINLT